MNYTSLHIKKNLEEATFLIRKITSLLESSYKNSACPDTKLFFNVIIKSNNFHKSICDLVDLMNDKDKQREVNEVINAQVS